MGAELMIYSKYTLIEAFMEGDWIDYVLECIKCIIIFVTLATLVFTLGLFGCLIYLHLN